MYKRGRRRIKPDRMSMDDARSPPCGHRSPGGRAGPGAGMNLAGRCTLSAFLREVFMTCLRVPSRFSPWLAMVLALGCGVARAQFTGMPSGNGADPGAVSPDGVSGRHAGVWHGHRGAPRARAATAPSTVPPVRLRRPAGPWAAAPGAVWAVPSARRAMAWPGHRGTAGSAPRAMGGSVRPAMAGWAPPAPARPRATGATAERGAPAR